MSAAVKRVRIQGWTLADSYTFISVFLRRYATSTSGDSASPTSTPTTSTSTTSTSTSTSRTARRHFHDYFVTHLPTSSLHPDSRASVGPQHHLPRSASVPHASSSTVAGTSAARNASPATISPSPTSAGLAIGRETTVVRIPLRSAKHHFGVSHVRGSRPTNEDTYQAGVIDLPAFARRAPLSVTVGQPAQAAADGNKVADSATGDPQVFYFGVFDGHGGTECSEFLRDKLHGYIQQAAVEFGMESALSKCVESQRLTNRAIRHRERVGEVKYGVSPLSTTFLSSVDDKQRSHAVQGDLPILQKANREHIGAMEKKLIADWRDLVGGYFRRFQPLHFSYAGAEPTGGEDGEDGEDDRHLGTTIKHAERGAEGEDIPVSVRSGVSIEEVVEYAFLRADLDFVSEQVSKGESKPAIPTSPEKPLNEYDILHQPNRYRDSHSNMPGGRAPHHKTFKGGSTGSIAMISTPTPTPFWHPDAPSSLLVSHIGDTRILLCSTATGHPIPLTTDHHPSSPVETARLQRYAATFVTDSFGEERMSGLANTRAFGDITSKRIGVSAEPELRRIDMRPAEYSFLVLMSDGVSGTLSDQEVVDIIKEAKTPDQGARDVVAFATEVSSDGDNATCLVVRLGGWERRQEGGLGSMATKEAREWRSRDAADPRKRRR
ncbi:protein phosphatase 2C [Trichophyton tonsurans CBS 112818]|uniref:Protein phosphatase 2c n=2 Tax=Trichophyton TaxID=5550 RepID=F2Q4W6_TRIEC|nr:protein phosphatase 2C [Trichophyton tonsurans CBS 112818]EGE09184.1 protein phosphatase 2c [Trichophyton equinum CBS 127.97]